MNIDSSLIGVLALRSSPRGRVPEDPARGSLLALLLHAFPSKSAGALRSVVVGKGRRLRLFEPLTASRALRKAPARPSCRRSRDPERPRFASAAGRSLRPRRRQPPRSRAPDPFRARATTAAANPRSDDARSSVCSSSRHEACCTARPGRVNLRQTRQARAEAIGRRSPTQDARPLRSTGRSYPGRATRLRSLEQDGRGNLPLTIEGHGVDP